MLRFWTAFMHRSDSWTWKHVDRSKLSLLGTHVGDAATASPAVLEKGASQFVFVACFSGVDTDGVLDGLLSVQNAIVQVESLETIVADDEFTGPDGWDEAIAHGLYDSPVYLAFVHSPTSLALQDRVKLADKYRGEQLNMLQWQGGADALALIRNGQRVPLDSMCDACDDVAHRALNGCAPLTRYCRHNFFSEDSSFSVPDKSKYISYRACTSTEPFMPRTIGSLRPVTDDMLKHQTPIKVPPESQGHEAAAMTRSFRQRVCKHCMLHGSFSCRSQCALRRDRQPSVPAPYRRLCGGPYCALDVPEPSIHTRQLIRLSMFGVIRDWKAFRKLATDINEPRVQPIGYVPQWRIDPELFVGFRRSDRTVLVYQTRRSDYLPVTFNVDIDLAGEMCFRNETKWKLSWDTMGPPTLFEKLLCVGFAHECFSVWGDLGFSSWNRYPAYGLDSSYGVYRPSDGPLSRARVAYINDSSHGGLMTAASHGPVDLVAMHNKIMNHVKSSVAPDELEDIVTSIENKYYKNVEKRMAAYRKYAITGGE